LSEYFPIFRRKIFVPYRGERLPLPETGGTIGLDGFKRLFGPALIARLDGFARGGSDEGVENFGLQAGIGADQRGAGRGDFSAPAGRRLHCRCKFRQRRSPMALGQQDLPALMQQHVFRQRRFSRPRRRECAVRQASRLLQTALLQSEASQPAFGKAEIRRLKQNTLTIGLQESPFRFGYIAGTQVLLAQ